MNNFENISEDYLSTTIKTYNQNVERFKDATNEKHLDIEMDTFGGYVPVGSKVLDAGCGTGRDTILLEQRGYDVSGFDPTENFIIEAKKNQPDVDFQIMDLRYPLEYADDSFEGIWLRAVLLHLTRPDMDIALKELKRILKPGGTIFIYTKKGEGSEIKEEKFSADGERFFSYIQEDELAEKIIKAGLNLEKIYSHNERDIFGEQFRDLWWICAFAKK